MRSLYKKLLLIWMLCLPIWLSGQVLTGEIVSISQPGCTPPITGEIEVGGINGTPPYTYTLDGTVIQATGLFSDLILGDHSIVINDEAGDTFTIPFTIEITSQMQLVVFDIKNVTCFGQNDGYITAIATSGVPPFQFSIDGGATFQASGTFNNLVNGNYSIIGIDDLGCVDTVLAVVAALTEINLVAINLEDISCYGDSSGSVQVLGELGTAPYQYSIDGLNYQSDENFTDISAGDYTFWVEDGNGCLGNLDLSFTEPNAVLLGDFNITPTTCFAGDDGSISFEASGGTAPYFYQLDGANDILLPLYENLNPGSYTLSAIDDNECQVDSVFSVGQADSIEINVDNFTLPLCFGDSNGSISFSATGGQGFYEYKIEGESGWLSSGLFSGLASSTYTLMVRDLNLCLNSIEFTLDDQLELDLSILVQTDVFCNISTDGAVEMNSSGGVLDYSYSIDGGSYQASPLFTNLSSGSYDLSVIDGNGCLDNMQVIIEETNDMSIDEVTIVGAICGMSNTGEMTVIASGGNSPYNYSIDGAPYQSSNVFASLDSGIHYLSLLGADGCEIDTAVYSPSISPLEFVVVDLVDPICVGSNSGSVELTVNNGNAPFQYSGDDGITWQGTNLFTGLIDSTYSFVIQDQDGCLVDSLISFEEQSDLSMDLVSISSILCPEATNGSITISGADGLLPYSYSDDGINFSPISVFNGLAPGDQQFWVQDANACIFDSVFTIEAYDAPDVIVDSLLNPTCNSLSNGVINLIANGAATPYSYSFEGSPYSLSSYYPNLLAGIYTIDFRDINSCSSTIELELLDAPPFILNIDSLKHIKCKNEEDGFIYYSLEGGFGPFNYRLNGGPWQAVTPAIGPLFAGNYFIEFMDDNGCIVSSSLIINEPALEFNVDILDVQDVDCLIDSIGSVIGMAEGGVSPYQYSMDSILFQSSGSFANLPPGDYTLYSIDENNCQDQEAFSIVANSPVALAWASIIPPSCETVSNGLLSVGVISGTYPFSFTLNSGTPQPGGTFSGLGEGFYEIEVIDDVGCTSFLDTLITSEETLNIVLDSVQNIVCVADSSGAIYLNANGGTPGYSYFVDGIPAPLGFLENLTNGVYQTWVVDAVGCNDSIEVAVLQESLLQGSIFSQQNILCNDGSLGSVTVNGTTGLSPYYYSIDGVNFDTTNTFTDLEEGDYTIVIQDATNCEVEVDVSIELLTEIELQIQSLLPSSCNGLDNGSASFFVQNGIGPYYYSIDNGTLSEEFSFSDLTAGEHVVYAEDYQGCNDTVSFQILEPDAILINIDSIGLASCFGMSDAYISISAENAVGDILYTIDPDGTSNSLGLFEGLGDDTYLLSVEDQNLCSSDTLITILSPSTLDADIVEINPISCYGNTNGIVQLVVIGGNAPYSYLVDSIDFGNNQYINNLDAGTHEYFIIDQNNCETAGEFYISQPDSILLENNIINNVSCFGLNNGNAFFSASGGNGGFSFELNSSIYSDNGAFSNLAPDSYTLTIYDSLMCSLEFEFLIIEPDLMVIDTILLENPLCFADTNGSATILVSGGTPDYNYFIPGIGSSSDSLFDNLEGGAYYISVTDNNGCNDSQIIILNEPDEFSIETLAVVPPLCFGDSTGTVLVQSEGGSGTHYYGLSWTSLTASSQFNSMPSGLAVIYAVDSLGCSDSTITFVPSVDPLFFGGVEDSSVSCYGLNDGAISFNPMGNGEGFLFSLDEINWMDTSIFSDLYADDYTFFMLDEFGCTIDTLMSLSQPDSLYISSISIFPVTCSDEFGGSISINVEGGIAPYESSLGSDIQIGPSVNFENLSIGNYQIISTDFNNCVFVLDTSLYEVDSVYASIDEIELNCYGDANGVATVNYIGGSGDYYFLWDNSSEDSTSITQPNLAADITYSVTVTDVLDSNCFAIAQVTPTQPPLIEFELYSYSPSCDPEDIWMNVELLNGGVAPFQYRINDEDPVESGVFSGLTMVSTRFEVIDADGCFVEEWTIPENPNTLQAYFEVSENEVTMAEGEVEFTNLGTNSSFLKWDFGNEISVEGDIGDPAIAEFTTGSIMQPIHNYTEAGEFIATLTAMSDFGCEDSYERPIIVEEDHRIYVPTSFTPDGDGINDIFLVQGSTIATEGFRLSIYDRSGTAIFQSFDINIGWEGLGLNGNKLRPDVYVFMVTYYSGGRLFEKNGTVTLLR